MRRGEHRYLGGRFGSLVPGWRPQTSVPAIAAVKGVIGMVKLIRTVLDIGGTEAAPLVVARCVFMSVGTCAPVENMFML